MAQNAGSNQGGVNKSRDKSADRHRRSDKETGAGQTEARPLDPGTRTDGGAPGNMTGRQR
ncbi:MULTISPECIES: hypothetical protein [Microvirga]|uniref:hypothetical protein n=1 Tax=Microvirga TaxID=186650 RepID=UPI001CFFD653|nr:hypothetical protein [Microvirga lenta]MCB5177601.1 hypothetical protein [Microvirga lenta]